MVTSLLVYVLLIDDPRCALRFLELLIAPGFFIPF